MNHATNRPAMLDWQPTGRSLAAIQADILERMATHRPTNPPSANPTSSPTTPNASSLKSSSKTGNSDAPDACVCAGAGWLRTQAGAVVRCTQCANLLQYSGLTASEQRSTLAMLRDLKKDPARHHLALRVAGHMILDQRFGFVTVWGNTGTAKSVWGAALAAEFCRRNTQARYLHAKTGLEEPLFGKGLQIDADRQSVLLRTPVLVVDELQSINWKSEWVAFSVQNFFDTRYRMAKLENPQRQVTILISQSDPATYAPDFLLSRIRDGRFRFHWPADVDRPGCIGRDGLITWPFHVNTPDLRPTLPAQGGK